MQMNDVINNEFYKISHFTSYKFQKQCDDLKLTSVARKATKIFIIVGVK